MNEEVFFYGIYCVVTVSAILLLAFFVLSYANKYTNLPIHISLFIGYMNVVVIEGGQYIMEEGKTGELTFSALRLFFYLFIFYLGWYFASKNLLRSFQSTIYIDQVGKKLKFGYRNFINKFVLLSLGIFLAIWMVVIVLNWPPPLFKEGLITRFVPIHERNIFSTNVFTFVPILLGYFVHKLKENIRVAYIMLFFYFILIMLNGQKFGGIVYGFFYFFAAKYITGKSVFRRVYISINMLKMTVLYGAVFLALIGVVLWHYETIAPNMAMTPMELLFQRIFVLQGHIWYAIDNRAEFLPTISTDVAFDNHSFMIGMMQISNQYIDIFAISEGIAGKFTFGFPAVMPYLMGHFFGFISCFFVGIVVCVVLDTVESIVLTAGLFEYLFAVYVFITIFSFLGTGDFFIFTSIRSIIVILFFSAIITSKSIQKKYKGG